MDSLLTFFKYAIGGFFGLVAFLIVIALLFGKRVRKQWEMEAEFRDAGGREFGEFEIEKSKIEKEETSYTLKAKLRMRHPSLTEHATVQVFVDDTLALESMVEKAGYIYLTNQTPMNAFERVNTGQLCRVVVGSTEIARAEFRPD